MPPGWGKWKVITPLIILWTLETIFNNIIVIVPDHLVIQTYEVLLNVKQIYDCLNVYSIVNVLNLVNKLTNHD